MQRMRFMAISAFLASTLFLAVDAADSAGQVPGKKAAKKPQAAGELRPRATANQSIESSRDLKPAFIGSSKDSAAVSKFLDARINEKLTAAKVTTSPICTDAEFLRRAYLDITGVIPSLEQTEAFLASTAPDKRSRLIDELLASSNYGRRQADIWMNLLVEHSSDNRRVDFNSFRTWLTHEFNQNRPWNDLVTEMVTASGTQDKNPAIAFYLSQNTVDKMTDEVCKVFLGMQLQCAQCHNHPFTGWKQTEYWAMASFFLKTDIGGLGKDQSPTVREVTTVRRNNKKNPLPESAKIVSPQFLQGPSPKIADAEPHRPVLAKWMTAPTNPYFAKAMVNRTWSQFFGVGLVNPVDDMHGANEPSHPELLTALAADFAASHFDVKHLIRSICNSQTYQRSSKPTADNDKVEGQVFAKMTVKVLTPEQLFDSLAQVTRFDRAMNAAAARNKNAKGYAPNQRDRFATFFLAGAEQPNSVEYEAGIPQALKLMNSRLSGNPALIRDLVGSTRGKEAIEKLYLTALSRRPTEQEIGKLTAYISDSKQPLEAYSDILWALLNTSEFTLNR